MYDGINSDAATIAQDFPAAQMVAGYVTGPFAWTTAEWDLFPHAAHVTIATTAQADIGDVLDVEAGDAAPYQTEAWITMRKAAGLYRPTIYCSLATVPAVRAGTGHWVLGTDYDLWVAHWDGITQLPYPLAAAKQDLSTATYDVSAVYDNLWPRRHAPVIPPPAVPSKAMALAAVATVRAYLDAQ
jgi:hypothetical protein